MKLIHKLLLFASSDTTISFLMRYNPNTTESAPKASPIVDEPVGTLTLVQTAGQFSSDSKTFVDTVGGGANWTSLGFWSGPYSSSKAILSSQLVKPVTLNAFYVAAWKAASGLSAIGQIQNAGGGLRLGGAQILGIDLDVNHWWNLWTVKTGTKKILGVNDELLYVLTGEPSSAEYVQYTNLNAINQFRFTSVAELEGDFSLSNDVATFDAAPSVNEEWTGYHDALIDVDWTPSAAEELQISARYIDANNRVYLSMTQGTVNNVKLVEVDAAVETNVTSSLVSLTLNAATSYHITFRFINYRWHLFVNGVRIWTQLLAERAYYGNIVKINSANCVNLYLRQGFVTDSQWRHANEIFAPRNTLTRNTISVPNGDVLDTYIAMLAPGDILSLAAGGNYTLGGGASGFVGVPSGTYYDNTIIEGNGATVTGGSIGLSLTGLRHITFQNLIIEDQTLQCLNVTDCSYLTFNDCIFRSDINPGVFNDTTKMQASHHLTFNDCTAGPSVGVASCDGFECFYAVYDTTFNRCIATGLSGADGNGYEVYTEPNQGECFNITFNDCHAEDCGGYGFSNEGGSQSRLNPNIQVNRATVSNNTDGDYRGTQGATLYVHDSQAGVEVGSVVQN